MKKVKKQMSLILAAALVFASLYTTAGAADTSSAVGVFHVPAVPVSYAFSVDGGSTSLWAYEIGGDTYFKLRDLASVLSGTDKQFEVGWDESKNAVSLSPGKAYTPVGGELSEPIEISGDGDVGAVAYPPTAAFYIGDKQVPIRSYLVGNAHYIALSDLAANLLLDARCDEVGHLAKLSTAAYFTGLYSLSLPEGWSADGGAGQLNFTRSGDPMGSLSVWDYDPDQPISQFGGNHAELLSSEKWDDLSCPAVKALIRRTQPAAAQDDSYVDELHIYLLLGDQGYAFDLCFDSAETDGQTARKIAESFVPDEAAIAKYAVAAKWAQAIQQRDGRAQYELLSAKLQAAFKDYYEDTNWVTGVSSPWVSVWTVEMAGDRAVVFYENRTSTGFAGYTIDTLAFAEEDGQLKISGIDGFNDFSGYKVQSIAAGA